MTMKNIPITHYKQQKRSFQSFWRAYLHRSCKEMFYSLQDSGKDFLKTNCLGNPTPADLPSVSSWPSAVTHDPNERRDSLSVSASAHPSKGFCPPSGFPFLELPAATQ